MPVTLEAGPGSFNGALGCLSAIQAQLANMRVHAYSVTPGSSTIPSPTNMVAGTEVGTHTARTVAVTNFFTQAARVGYELAATTAGTFAEFYQGVAQFFRGTGKGIGGFAVSYRFGPSDAAAVSGKRQFHGLMASVSALTNVEPDTFVDCFGLAQLAASGNLQLIFNDASGTCTTYDLGANFPGGSLSTDWYTFQFFVGPKGDRIIWSLVNETTGYRTGGEETSNLPTATTLLAWHSFCGNNSTALKAAFDFGSLQIFTNN